MTLHIAAAADHDGIARFAANNEGHMASLVAAGAGGAREVPAVDFAAWLRRTASEADFVHLKMDIEGGEFALMGHLAATGALPKDGY